MKLKKILSFAAAALSAALLVNLVCAAVYTLPPKYPSPHAATQNIWEENTPVRHALEGFARNHTDQNGYNNPDGILQGSYALALGSSHTQAFNVDQEKNFCSLYNRAAEKQHAPLLYNAAMDGNNFTDIVKQFPAAREQFPDAAFFLIETPYFTFSEEELLSALDQQHYAETPEETGFSHTLYRLVQSVPLARLFVRQILETDYSEFGSAFRQASPKPEETPAEISLSVYEKQLNACFAALRRQTDKPVFLLYHTIPKLTSEGLTLQTEQIQDTELLPIIQKLCDTYQITLLDPSARYLAEYEQNHTLPYGFANTTYGEGHLNETGHALIAGILKEVLL